MSYYSPLHPQLDGIVAKVARFYAVLQGERRAEASLDAGEHGVPDHLTSGRGRATSPATSGWTASA